MGGALDEPLHLAIRRASRQPPTSKLKARVQVCRTKTMFTPSRVELRESWGFLIQCRGYPSPARAEFRTFVEVGVWTVVELFRNLFGTVLELCWNYVDTFVELLWNFVFELCLNCLFVLQCFLHIALHLQPALGRCHTRFNKVPNKFQITVCALDDFWCCLELFWNSGYPALNVRTFLELVGGSVWPHADLELPWNFFGTVSELV